MNTEQIVEQWKPISGLSNAYEVSNFGRVRNCATGTIRKPYFLKKGYAMIRLYVNGKRNHMYIHRLVAEAFCEHPDGCDVVNHLDNDASNNRADNLEWTTQFGNVHHGMKQKRYYKNAIPVIGYKDGKRYEFLSTHDAARKTGCGDKEIARCCKNSNGRSKGFRWEYSEVM